MRDLPLLTEAERHQLLVEWNDTDVHYPADGCSTNCRELRPRAPGAVAWCSKINT